MNHLDNDLRQALQARDGPPPGAQARNLALLRAQLGGPSAPLDDGGSSFGNAGVDPSAPVTSLWAAKVTGATLGLAAAGLVALKLGAAAIGVGGTGPSAEPPAEAPALIAEAAAEGPRESPAAAEEPVAAEEPGPEPEPSDESAATPDKARPTVASPTPAAGGSSSGTSLDAELALIGAAKQERDVAPKAALAKLAEHASTFPEGVLAPEREALKIELLCGLARAEEARAAAARFRGSAPLRARFEAACKVDGVELEP